MKPTFLNIFTNDEFKVYNDLYFDRSSPFFVHATSGVGTTQLKSTVCFSSFVRLVGGSEISGPTSNVKIKN